MPALYGTVAVEKVEHLATTVPDHLHLQVATARQVTLDKQRGISEGSQRFAAGGGQRSLEFLRPGRHSHSFAATPSNGFYQRREPDLVPYPSHNGDRVSFPQQPVAPGRPPRGRPGEPGLSGSSAR